MYKELSKKLFIPLLGILFISSCGGNTKKEDFDLSNFKVPIKKSLSKIDLSNEKNLEQKEVEFKLIPLNKRNEILNSMKYGKKDPFSSVESTSNQFISNFQVNGFISIDKEDYVLVEFNNQKGMINIHSIGGLNTKLIPNKAFVTSINPSQGEVNLSLDDKIFNIKLGSN